MKGISRNTVTTFAHNFVSSIEEVSVIKVALLTIATYGLTLFFRTSYKIRALVCVLANLSYITYLAFRKSPSSKLDDNKPTKSSLPQSPVVSSLPQLPVDLKKQIKYESLKDYGISLEKIEQYESEIDSDNFGSILNFIQTLVDSDFLMNNLISTNLLQWLLAQINKLLKKKQISEELCAKIHDKFSKRGLFSLNENFVLINGKIKVNINNLAVLLASTYARTVHYSNFEDGKEKQELTVSDCSQKSLQEFREYLMKKTLSNQNSLETLSELLNIARMFLIPELEKEVFKQFETFDTSSITNQEALDRYLNCIQTCSDKVVDLGACFSLACKGIETYLKTSYQSTEPFKLYDGVFSLPIGALSHLGRQDGLGKLLLDHVNTISLPKQFSSQNLEAFRLLRANMAPETFQRLTNLVFAFTNDSGFKGQYYEESYIFDKKLLREFFTEFPQVKNVYITPTDLGQHHARLSVDAIEAFKQEFPDKKIIILPSHHDIVKMTIKNQNDSQRIVNILVGTEVLDFRYIYIEESYLNGPEQLALRAQFLNYEFFSNERFASLKRKVGVA